MFHAANSYAHEVFKERPRGVRVCLMSRPNKSLLEQGDPQHTPSHQRNGHGHTPGGRFTNDPQEERRGHRDEPAAVYPEESTGVHRRIGWMANRSAA